MPILPSLKPSSIASPHVEQLSSDILKTSYISHGLNFDTYQFPSCLRSLKQLCRNSACRQPRHPTKQNQSLPEYRHRKLWSRTISSGHTRKNRIAQDDRQLSKPIRRYVTLFEGPRGGMRAGRRLHAEVCGAPTYTWPPFLGDG